MEYVLYYPTSLVNMVLTRIVLNQQSHKELLETCQNAHNGLIKLVGLIVNVKLANKV